MRQARLSMAVCYTSDGPKDADCRRELGGKLEFRYTGARRLQLHLGAVQRVTLATIGYPARRKPRQLQLTPERNPL